MFARCVCRQITHQIDILWSPKVRHDMRSCMAVYTCESINEEMILNYTVLKHLFSLSRSHAPPTLPPPSSPPPPSPPPISFSPSPSPSPRPSCRPCRGRKWALDVTTCQCSCTIRAESCTRKNRSLNTRRCRSVHKQTFSFYGFFFLTTWNFNKSSKKRILRCKFCSLESWSVAFWLMEWETLLGAAVSQVVALWWPMSRCHWAWHWTPNCSQSGHVW